MSPHGASTMPPQPGIVRIWSLFEGEFDVHDVQAKQAGDGWHWQPEAEATRLGADPIRHSLGIEHVRASWHSAI